MGEIILAVPTFIIAALLQISVFGSLHLLKGSVDLFLLIVIAWSLNEHSHYSWAWALFAGSVMSVLSAMPMYGYMLVYLAVWVIITFLKKRVWQMPVILMMLMTIIGTVMEGFFTMGALVFQGVSVDFADGFNLILVPSLAMNLMAAFPVYVLFNDITNTLHYNEE